MSSETEQSVIGWTVDTLHSHVRQLLEERDHRYQIRFDLVRDNLATLMSESDKRYEQRFIAQQEAIQAALLAQKEAVNAALVAARPRRVFADDCQPPESLSGRQWGSIVVHRDRPSVLPRRAANMSGVSCVDYTTYQEAS